MRLPKLDHSAMTPRQREAHDRHVAKRKRASGPYGVWLHSPVIVNRRSRMCAVTARTLDPVSN
jgi:hypothetical protein